LLKSVLGFFFLTLKGVNQNNQNGCGKGGASGKKHRSRAKQPIRQKKKEKPGSRRNRVKKKKKGGFQPSRHRPVGFHSIAKREKPLPQKERKEKTSGSSSKKNLPAASKRGRGRESQPIRFLTARQKLVKSSPEERKESLPSLRIEKEPHHCP